MVARQGLKRGVAINQKFRLLPEPAPDIARLPNLDVEISEIGCDLIGMIRIEHMQRTGYIREMAGDAREQGPRLQCKAAITKQGLKLGQ